MFGYFRPRDSYLRNNEYTTFRQYYCRLCYCLWNLGGQKARYLTTFDAALFSIVVFLSGCAARAPHVACQKIRTENRNKYFRDDKDGKIIADITAIGLATKTVDNKEDGDKEKVFLANLFFRGVMKDVVKRNPKQFEMAVDANEKINSLQRDGAPIEEVLDVYGDFVGKLFSTYYPLSEPYLKALYWLARWTFFVDMLVDYDEDYAEKKPNSLIEEGTPTIIEYFNKHYAKLSKLIEDEEKSVKAAIYGIKSDELEWGALRKIVDHSLATTVPGILNGDDVQFHYFRDTAASLNDYHRRKETLKREKRNIDIEGD